MQPALSHVAECRQRLTLPSEELSLPDLRTALRIRVSGVDLSVDMALAPIDHLFDGPGSTLRFAREPLCYYYPESIILWGRAGAT